MNVGHVTMLHEYLERSVARDPGKTALVFHDRRLTWSEVDDLAWRVARLLVGLGVKRGDRVVLFLDNSVELAVAIYGVLRADALFVAVNGQTKADRLTYVLNDCRPSAVIAARSLARVWREAIGASPHVRHVILTGPARGAADVEGGLVGGAEAHDFDDVATAAGGGPIPSRNIPTDLAAIIYTSGSTADPKGVMLTHHNMVSAAESITTYLENQHDDIVINALPMSFDYGLYQWLMVTLFGGTLILEQSFSYPAAVLQKVVDERVTGLPVVPTMASLLKPFAARGFTLPGVRYVTNTAAALTGSHVETLKAICPQARVYSMYGLTECKRVSYLPPEDLDRKPGSVGRAMPNMEVYISGADGAPLPPNTVGELVVRGPHVMKGYWEKPEATAERLRPGDIPGEFHLRTGDQFRMDEDGYLYFVARGDDVIKSRGEKVSPGEVENALYSMAAVQDAVVAGVPDEILGQAIHAFVVPLEGASCTREDVIRHCAERLEPVMVPRYVTFVSALPKTTSGKIVRRDLLALARAAYVSGDRPG